MEEASRDEVFYEPHHPYTEGLLRSLPAYGGERARLHPIAGQPPSLIHPPKGCPFAPRCPYVMEICTGEQPELRPSPQDPGHLDRCYLDDETKEREATHLHETMNAQTTV